MEQIQVIDNNGKFDCKINISTKEWLELLKDPVITPPNTWKALLGFYYSPNFTANCKELDNDNPNAFKNPISSFGKLVQDKLGRFQVLTSKGDEGNYFIIPMTGFSNKSGFAWTIRPELAKAIKIILKLQDNLILEAIEQYKQKLENDPIYWNGDPKDKKLFGEKYKWEALAHFQKNWKNVEAAKFAKMFEEATKETKNLLDVDYWNAPRKRIIISANYNPQKVKEMFHYLYENNDDFDLHNKDSVSRVRKSIEAFIQDDIKLVSEIVSKENPDQKDYSHLFQNTNAISTYLWLKYPDKYYKYAYDIFAKNKNKLCLYQYDINKRKGCSIDSMFEGFAMYDKIRAKLLKDKELVDMINTRVDKLHLETDFNDEFHTATIDFGYFLSLPTTQLNQELDQNMNNSEFNNKVNEIANILNYKKNVILQGAPGTGKTYITAAVALKILGVDDNDFDFSDHSTVMERYEKYRKEKRRLFFTTFHQSMDYEDFVEGLKPVVTDEGVRYDLEKGIFRIMCDNAHRLSNERKTNAIDFTRTRIFKMSLGEKDKNDSSVFDYCKENNVVALGWGENKDFSNYQTPEGILKLYEGEKDNRFGPIAMERFICWMRKGDIILISDGNSAVKAIARIVGDYEFHNDTPIGMCQFRKVEWLYLGENIPLSKLYDIKFIPQCIYGFYSSKREGTSQYNGSINTDMINKIITGEVNSEEPQPYVLIIDEINRGNVSKIFGELVTLLEKDKRDDCDHPITVKLPYSKDDFSVPSNVYIIGTMNTTDRSTGTLDYAIRRRFAFVTLPAEPNVVPEGIARDIFNDIKKFIEDEKNHPEDMDVNDLMVGHSYFMPDNEVPLSTEEQLKLKIKYEVAPLLREYCTDGLLTCSQKELEKRIESWEKLEITYKKDSNATSAAAASESETSQNNE